MILIKAGQVFTRGRLKQADILVSKGKIVSVAKGLEPHEGCKEIDASGLIVLPGVIDPHVHFREPGFTKKEDFLTGSRSAAKGGMTTVIDMPNTDPPTTLVRSLNRKRKLAKKSVVNHGFHFGANLINIKEIKKLSKKKNRIRCVASIKIYMDITTGSMIMEDEKKLQEVFRNFRIISVHAEEDKVGMSLRMIKNTKNRLYLCHISRKSELDAIRKFLKKNKKVKNRVFIEATPHHLFLNENDLKKLKMFGMMKPSLATKKDQRALWRAIRTGLVNTIGTDHAPHTIEEKRSDRMYYGVPGVETILPLLLNAVNRKKITLKRLVELTSLNPSRIFGIKNKGKIKQGYDADLVLVDMRKIRRVRNGDMITKCGWSPFNGKRLRGWPAMTIVNGKIVYDNLRRREKIYNVRAKEIVCGVF